MAQKKSTKQNEKITHNLKMAILLVAVGFGIGAFFFNKKSNSGDGQKVIQDSKLIAHEIKKMNKMITVEQDFSQYKSQEKKRFDSKYLNFLNKNIVLYIKAKAQVVYDMKQMDIQTDTVAKVLHIKKLPEPELAIYYDVDVYDIKNGWMNNYSSDEINKIKEEGKTEVREVAEKSDLKQRGNQQLMENLESLFFVAKTYNWKIQNDTNINVEQEIKKESL